MKKWYWLVAAGIFLFLLAEYGMSPRPIDSPRYYYNLDSACYYMHFYIIGFLAYPYLKEWLEKTGSIAKSIKTVIAVGLLVYAGLMYFQINVLSYIPIHNMIADSGLRLVKTYLMIGAIIMLAYYLQGIEVLAKVGQDTLYSVSYTHLENGLEEDICMDELPVVCKGYYSVDGNYKKRATAQDITDTAKTLFAEIGMEPRQLAYLENELAQNNLAQIVNEKDATAYLLRRNYARCV